MRAAQEIEADKDLAFALELHQLALETGEGTLDDTDGVAGGEGDGAEADGLGAVVEHEAEAVHLLVGDDGRLVLAAQHHVARDGGQREGQRTLLRRDADEEQHGEHQAVHALAAVAPLADDALHGQVALDAHGPEALGRLLLHARLDVGHEPLTLVGITSSARTRCHIRSHIRTSCHNRSSGHTCHSRSNSRISCASCPAR